MICRKIDLDCYVSFKVKNFDLISNGSISLKLNESESFCSEIAVKIQISSSILDETSTITTRISSDTNKYFRGSSPSVFTFLMIPSLFEADTGALKTDQTGYHISLLEDPINGSQVNFSE